MVWGHGWERLAKREALPSGRSLASFRHRRSQLTARQPPEHIYHQQLIAVTANPLKKITRTLSPIHPDLSSKAIVKYLASSVRAKGTARKVGVASPKRRERHVRKLGVGGAGVGRGGEGCWRKRGGSRVERLVEQALFAQASSLRFFPVSLVVRAVGQSE